MSLDKVTVRALGTTVLRRKMSIGNINNFTPISGIEAQPYIGPTPGDIQRQRILILRAKDTHVTNTVPDTPKIAAPSKSTTKKIRAHISGITRESSAKIIKVLNHTNKRVSKANVFSIKPGGEINVQEPVASRKRPLTESNMEELERKLQRAKNRREGPNQLKVSKSGAKNEKATIKLRELKPITPQPRMLFHDLVWEGKESQNSNVKSHQDSNGNLSTPLMNESKPPGEGKLYVVGPREEILVFVS